MGPLGAAMPGDEHEAPPTGTEREQPGSAALTETGCDPIAAFLHSIGSPGFLTGHEEQEQEESA